MRRPGLVAGALAGTLLLTGCGTGGFSGVYDMPLPGGADLGAAPYRITARFTDVLDLVPQASVKVDDVPVGRVDKVELAPDTHSAIVHMSVNGKVRLPANASAMLRQSSLLGEKFIELDGPQHQQASGALADGDSIPLSRTNRNPEVEEVLGALSLLLNGGGVNQLGDIIRELNKTFGGNETEIRALLGRVDQLATELDGQRGDIVRAIDGLDRLSGTLKGQTGNLANALDNLAPGLKVVTEQRDQLVGMLRSLDRLSGVTVDTVNKSKDQLVANLRALTPTLRRLAQAGRDLPTALRILPTYPLPDVAGDTVRGDYGNVRVRLDLDLDSILKSVTNAGKVSVSLPKARSPITLPVPAAPRPEAPTPGAASPGAPSIGGLGDLLDNLLGGGT